MADITIIRRMAHEMQIADWLRTTEGRLNVANILGCARAKDNGNEASILPVDDLRRILERQGYRCAYCVERIIDNFTLDHKAPVSKLGGHTLDNIQFLCPACNNKKRAGPELRMQGEKMEYEYVGRVSKCMNVCRVW